MNDEILRLYRQLRKERRLPGNALRAARSAYQNTVVANMLGIPSAKEIAHWFYETDGHVVACGYTVSLKTLEYAWHNQEDDLGGSFVDRPSARERRGQEVFSIDAGRRQDQFVYFRPTYSEATYRADCERAKTGKAEAIRRAREYRQRLVDGAQSYHRGNDARCELQVEVCDREPEYFVLCGERDDDLRVAEEIRAVLCYALPRNHC